MDADQLDLKITGRVVTPGQVLRLPSHADHDANQMAKIAPIGMLFAPSRDGRSHCPEEGTEPDDIAVCLAALTAAVIRLDEELAP